MATFDGTATTNCTIDEAVNVAGIDINAGYTGEITQGNNTVTVGSSNYDQAAGTFTGGSSTIDVNRNFTLSGGTFTSTSNTLSIEGDFTISGGTFEHNSGTVRFIATVTDPQTVNIGTTQLNHLTLDRATFTVTVTGTIDVNGDLTITSISSLNGGTITVAGNVITTDDSVAGTGTILFDGTGNQTLGASGGTGMLPNVSINKASGTLTIEDTIRVDRNWTYTAGTVDAGTSTVVSYAISSVTAEFNAGSMAFHHVTLERFSADANVTGTLDVNGNFTITSISSLNGGTITVAGNVITTYGSVGGTAAITLDGTGSQTITASSADFPNGTFTINKSSGTATLASALSVNATGQDLTIAEGVLDLAGFALTVNDQFTIEDGGTLQLQGAESVATIDTLASGSTVIFTGDGDSAADTYTITSLASTYHHLTINSTDGATDTFDLGADLDVNGNLTITAGTVDVTTSGCDAGANPCDITLAGNWSNSGTFTARTGKVTLDGTNQTMSGSTTFYDLTKNVASAATLTFTAGTTQTITNTMDLQGASGQLLSLRSSSNGTQWNINPQGTRTIDFLDVKDSKNTNATPIDARTANSTDSGNNSGWVFSTTSNFTWIGLGADSNWNTTGNWMGGSVPGSSDTALFDDTSTKDATINTAVDVSGIDIQSGYTGTITQASGNTVTIGSGNYAQAAGTLTGGDSAIDLNGDFTLTGGTFTSTSGEFSVSGDFDPSGGTFTHNSGTVVFDGAGTTTISGGTTFNNFKSTTAGKAITFTAGTTQTVNGTLTLTGSSGSLVTLRSSSSGSSWDITFPNGSQSVSFVDVKDSDANTNSVTCQNCTNGGNNNNNWKFEDPFGVVFDSVTNTPIEGAVITLFNSSGTQATPGVELAATDSNPFTTGSDGSYQFLAANGDYYFTITADGYTYPSSKTSFASGRTIVTGSKGEVFTISGSSIEMDHPMDPSTASIRLTKDVNKSEARVGEVVTYTVTAENLSSSNATGDVTIEDRIPAGFKFISGKATLGGSAIPDPTGPRPLEFPIGSLAASQSKTLKYQLVVGAGVTFGNYENAAVAKLSDGTSVSNTAVETVAVVPDVVFDLGTVIGRVFWEEKERFFLV